jgi:molybdenum cofactor biosynthesis enzyme MoaA
LIKTKTVSSIYTNSWFLKKKAQELKDAGVMVMITSLDSTNAEKHDKFRRLPKLFDKAIEKIKECQRIGMLTAISTTVVQEDLDKGNFENMIHFAKKIKVNELIVFDTMPVGMDSHLVDLLKNKINFNKLFSIVDKYNKDDPFQEYFVMLILEVK